MNQDFFYEEDLELDRIFVKEALKKREFDPVVQEELNEIETRYGSLVF